MTDNSKKKKEAEKRTDKKEATKLNQRNFNKEYLIKNDVIQMTSKKKWSSKFCVIVTHIYNHGHDHKCFLTFIILPW